MLCDDNASSQGVGSPNLRKVMFRAPNVSQCYEAPPRKPAWMLHCYMLQCYTTYEAVRQSGKERQGQQVQFIPHILNLVASLYILITL